MSASSEHPLPSAGETIVDLLAGARDVDIALKASGRPPLTYGGLRAQVEKTVASLNRLGVGRNDSVAIVLPNGPEMASSFVSIAAGATTAPLNPAYKAEEFEFYLSDLDAKLLVVDAKRESPAVEAAQKLGVPIATVQFNPEDPVGTFELAGEPVAAGCAQGGYAAPDDVALVLHTSGTTSRPKIVPLSHTNICASAFNIRTMLELTTDDCCLNIMPLFHIHGLMGALLSSLSAGAKVCCTPGFDAAHFFPLLREFTPSWYSGVPTMHQAILKRAGEEGTSLEGVRLRLIRSSSASLPPPVMEALEGTFNAPVIESYGMTEAAHQMASNPLPPGERKAGFVGLAAGPEIAIMDAGGELLPTGSVGEVVIRGSNVTTGYRNNPAATDAAFTAGWFRTGDEGVLDEGGYLRLTGRLKEVINRGGEKIMPCELDEALMDHPAVAQAVAFAVPHPTLGEDVAAAVVLRDSEMVTGQALREFLFDRVALFKVPSLVLLVDEIPKGPTGKVQRIGLAEQLAPLLEQKYVAPSSPLEIGLAQLWAEVLGVERVGREENFFALGVDSLLAAQVKLRIETAFKISVPLERMFRDPTVGAQALLIEDSLLREVEGAAEEEYD